MRARSFIAVLATLAASAPAFADDAHEDADPEHYADDAHHHADHIALFGGATAPLRDDDRTHFTAGADYEHRLPFAHVIGVGALVDFNTVRETLLAGFVAVHPIGGLMVLGAVGVGTTGFVHDGRLGLRAGVAYFIPIGELSIGPVVSFDRSGSDNAIVYGVAVGSGL